jgi:hypothetical protein
MQTFTMRLIVESDFTPRWRQRRRGFDELQVSVGNLVVPPRPK